MRRVFVQFSSGDLALDDRQCLRQRAGFEQDWRHHLRRWRNECGNDRTYLMEASYLRIHSFSKLIQGHRKLA